MTIRRANHSDLKQLSMLFDAYRVFYEKQSDLESAKLFLSDRIKNGDSEIAVAEDATDGLVGFVQLYPLFSSTRMNKLWLLNDLYLSPAFRGRGVSIMLIDYAKDLAKKTNSAGLILETAKSNAIGNSLYSKTGFTLDVDRNFYSWDNESR